MAIRAPDHARFDDERRAARQARHELDAQDAPAADETAAQASARQMGRLRVRAAQVMRAARARSSARRRDRPAR